MLKRDPGGSAFSELTVGQKEEARCTPTCHASQKAVREFREESNFFQLFFCHLGLKDGQDLDGKKLG